MRNLISLALLTALMPVQVQAGERDLERLLGEAVMRLVYAPE